MEKKKRKPRRKSKHQLLLDEHRHRYPELLEAQGGKCALCPRVPSPKRRLDIDHNHKTMKIRGLLCSRCNRALVYWMTKEWLEAAAEYVDKEV